MFDNFLYVVSAAINQLFPRIWNQFCMFTMRLLLLSMWIFLFLFSEFCLMVLRQSFYFFTLFVVFQAIYSFIYCLYNLQCVFSASRWPQCPLLLSSLSLVSCIFWWELSFRQRIIALLRWLSYHLTSSLHFWHQRRLTDATSYCCILIFMIQIHLMIHHFFDHMIYRLRAMFGNRYLLWF